MDTIPQILFDAYRNAPDRTAITLLFSDRPEVALNYRDLVRFSAGYAASLAESGVATGEVVILILDHGADLVCAFFGAILHGAVPAIMPFLTEKLSTEHYRASLAALFAITSPRAIITYPEFVPEVQAAIENADHTGRFAPMVLSSDQVLTARPINWDELGGVDRSPNDTVLLQHSSGTTGLQKGVALSHQAIIRQIENYAPILGLNQDDVIVSWLPLYHDMGLIAGFIMPVLARTRLVLMSPFDWVRGPYRLMQAISKYRGTLCWLPNFAYNFCARKIRDRELEGVNLSSLRAVINCSEPMHWSSHQMFLERFQSYGLSPQALATCYAMAENVFAVTQGGINGPIKEDLIDPQAFSSRQVAVPVDGGQHEGNLLRMQSAGSPINNTKLRVIDPSGNDLPERHVGEISLQSNCMLSGYYNRPDATEKAFLEGWYLTGDLGYLADGELYITGRAKDLIIVGGKNVYPQDLEHLVEDVDGVHHGRVVAFGVFNENTGTEDVVVIAEVDMELESKGIPCVYDPASPEGKIAAQIRQSITQGSEIALRYVCVVGRNWLLKTSSGKVARSANREKYLSEMG